MKQTVLVAKNMAYRHKQLAHLARTAGGQALIVVPEIWLLEKVKASFLEKSSVATIQAGLPSKQQMAIWRKVKHHELKVIIGTQKALFLPWQHLSLIIVEEEFFPTHKLWNQYPRLSNIDGALALAKIWDADIIWSGSLTSLRLRQAMAEGKVAKTVLHPVRPRVKMIRTTYEDRRRGWLLPRQFIQELRAAKRNHEKVVMLRNRRGATGIDSIQALLKQIYGSQSSFLVDTAALFTHQKDSLADRVVWLFPEDSLLYPDFRASERAWYTLARLQQLVRAGRPVILVSRGQAADRVEEILGQDPDQFYTHQLAERERFGYPPFRDMVRLTTMAKTPGAAQRKAEQLRQNIEERITTDDVVSLHGPFASFEKTTLPQRHLLLLGSLPRLTQLYIGQKADRVDLSPERII